jgi:diguanylate cyclase (GGDEF)-like protein
MVAGQDAKTLVRLVEDAPNPIIRFDSDLRVTYLNTVAVGLLGDAVGRSLPELGDAVAGCEAQLRVALGSGRRVHHEVVCAARPYDALLCPERDEGERITGIVVYLHDVGAYKQAADRMAWQAAHDPVTGAANRYGLLATAERVSRERGLGVLFVDLDDFKSVNDRYGHTVGDAVLVVVAQRLASTVRPEDFVARWGGDEFVVLCEGLRDEDEAVHVAERVVTALAEPIAYGDLRLRVGASLGVALATGPEETVARVVDRADAGLLGAKAAGKSRIVLVGRGADHPVTVVRSSP